MRRFVCIHGHFYQPPRENPWLEEVETEDSASPYHDWNQRITAECYAPNSASRILDSRNRILNIINNYAYMSFNFGPTLLSWLEQNETEVYQAVLAADEDSLSRFSGHGSALAQPYNHTILPLAGDEDKRTQILWGIWDFRVRFARDPEGMWLPETAVDLETLDLMSDAGIRFTILGPHQAARIRRQGERNWQDVQADRIDTRQPYVCRLPSGRSLVLYFYAGAIAREVAFGDLLKSGRDFSGRLRGGFSQESRAELMHIATDGETYGHHHRFGEMALSYVLHQIHASRDVQLTNYSAFLAQHPPEFEVEIRENTSWSCAHGVERWRADCGCSSGAHPKWSQAWRAPLRTAMDQLRRKLDPAYEKAVGLWGPDPWDLRNAYIQIMQDRSRKGRRDFLTRFSLETLSAEKQNELWKWLEMQRNRQMMYTSCGWFFDEISGLESVQVMRYAARAMQLARELGVPDLEPEFMLSLKKAPSNRPRYRHGEEVYRSLVQPAVLDLTRIGAHHAVAAVFLKDKDNQAKPAYTLSFSRLQQRERENRRLAVGRFTLESRATGDKLGLSFAAVYLGRHDVRAGLAPGLSEQAQVELEDSLLSDFAAGDFDNISRLQDRFLQPERFGLPHLFKDAKREIVTHLLESVLRDFEGAIRPFYARDLDFIHAVQKMNVPLPSVLAEAMGFLRHREIYRKLENGELAIEELQAFAAQVKDGTFKIERQVMGLVLSRALEKMLEQLDKGPDEGRSLKRLETFVSVLCELSLDLNLWKSQNLYFELWKRCVMRREQPDPSRDPEAKAYLKSLKRIGDFLNVRMDA